MDQILLCSHYVPLNTLINNSFIQNYMLDANGSYVKVYLYLSMCIQSGERNLSISSLADKMENTEKDILRALRYWEKRGLMALQKDISGTYITSIEIINPDALGQPNAPDTDKPIRTTPVQEDTSESVSSSGTKFTAETSHTAIQENTAVKPTEAAQPETVSQPKMISQPETVSQPEIPEVSVTEEQTLRLAENDDFRWLCLIVESYLERPLHTAEVQLMTYLFDTLDFSKDLILHLYEYCCSLGKTNVKYVQAVALSWAKQNITTPEQAKEYSANYSAAHSAIAKTLGLGRPLAKIECAYAERWQNQWHMDLAVIIEACNRTMLSIQKADFKYIEGILSNWHKENVHTLQDIKLCDEAHNRKKAKKQKTPDEVPGKSSSAKRTQFQAFQQRDTSKEEIDQLEQMLLTR